jgi:hypothetical protein
MEDQAPRDGHRPNGVKVAEFNDRTVIACECGAKPKAPSARMSAQHVWHAGHRRRLGLQPVDYIWPDDRYMSGLSVGGYVRVRGHVWRDGCRVKDDPQHEANVLREAIAIMREHRGGLETTIAVLEETERALRNAAGGKS